MIVPKISLDGALSIDQAKGATTVQSGTLGSVSPRPDRARSTSQSDEGTNYFHHQPGQYRPMKDGGRSPSPSMAGNAAYYGMYGAHQSVSRSNSPDQVAPSNGSKAIHFYHCDVFRRGKHYHPSGKAAGGTKYPGGVVAPRSSPVSNISCIAANGGHNGCDLVALGDRGGNIFLLKRHDSSQHHGEANWQSHASRVAYTSVIDPLNSLEVTPKVNKLCFIPRIGTTPYLLSTNEKVPKLWKIIEVRQSPASFKAVNCIGMRTVPPLTLPDVDSATLIKESAKFAMDHEYTIHSIACTPEGTGFLSCDELSVRSWDLEHPQTSLEVLNIKPPNDEVRESLTSAQIFPVASSLVFMTTTMGTVKVFDLRQSLRWNASACEILQNPQRTEDREFSAVTSGLSSCVVTSDLRYVIGRDFMSLCLWDMRQLKPRGGTLAEESVATPIVARWALHPHLSEHFEALYQLELLFEKLDVQVTQGNEYAVTGSMDGSLAVATIDKVDEPLQYFPLPAASLGQKSIIRPTSSKMQKGGGADVDYGQRVTYLASAPGATPSATHVFAATEDRLHVTNVVAAPVK